MRYEISELDDPRLEPYSHLRSRNWTEQSGIFIAEGPLLVERLLASDYKVRSVLIDRKFEPQYAPRIGATVDVLLVEHDNVEQIVGFNFHRGVLGCGIRNAVKEVQPDLRSATIANREILVAAWGVQDPENLGGILRSSAALGIEKVIIGQGTADPLSRRVLRVSMGTALKLQLYRSRDLLSDLNWMRQNLGIQSIATTLQPGAESLESTTQAGPAVILVGNERNGLPASLQAAADRRVRIGMELGTDSLNVCVAAGIVMHHFCRIASPLFKTPD